MKYDFDTVVDRRTSYAVKWDVCRDGELPMWVADMDFKAAPEILEALRTRLDNGVFGYSSLPEEWAMSYVHWWKNRHGLEIDPSRLTFATGVIPILSSAVREFTSPLDNVLIQSPVYNMFFKAVSDNGRKILESPLVYEDDAYSMDFDDLEAKLSDPRTTMMILCNPHNPAGRIWSRTELETLGDLCFRHDVLVLSDEIHCDITDPGVMYTPFASVSGRCRDNSITAIAPTKCFNIAGIQSAAAMAPDPVLCRRIRKALESDSVAEPNAFAIAATIAAFEHCGPWLDEMRSYVFENKQTVLSFVEKNIPDLHVVPSAATYLLWLDCSAYISGFPDSEALAKEIRRKTGLFLSNGIQYGEPGRSFLRMNIACPRTLLLDGLDRLAKALSGIREAVS